MEERNYYEDLGKKLALTELQDQARKEGRDTDAAAWGCSIYMIDHYWNNRVREHGRELADMLEKLLAGCSVPEPLLHEATELLRKATGKNI